MREIEERKGFERDRGEEGVWEILRRGRDVGKIEDRKGCERE